MLQSAPKHVIFYFNNSKFFWGGGTAHSPDPSPSGRRTPPLAPTPLGVCGASVYAPSALTHAPPTRKSGYGPVGKISYEHKARMETLRELGFGYRTIVAEFPEKVWKLCSVKAICKRVDERGPATERKQGIAIGRKQHEL